MKPIDEPLASTTFLIDADHEWHWRTFPQFDAEVPDLARITRVPRKEDHATNTAIEHVLEFIWNLQAMESGTD